MQIYKFEKLPIQKDYILTYLFLWKAFVQTTLRKSNILIISQYFNRH